MEGTNTSEVSKIHPDKESFTNDIRLGDETPKSTVQAVIAIVTHHKVNTGRYGTAQTISEIFAFFTIWKA
jgi:hypothetical protein